MKVYRVREDVRDYQGLTPVEMDAWLDFALSVDCRPKMAIWTPLEMYVREPMLIAGDFFSLTPGFFVTGERALPHVGEFLEMAGERLPVRVDGRELSLLNVTQCINCLDRDRSVWANPQKAGAPVKYVFHRERVDESSLFKIPETYRGEILALEREEDPESEFKAAVDKHGLRGLIFEELWSDH